MQEQTGLGVMARALRRALGLTVRELALRADVSAGYVTQIEKGGANPSLAVLARLADALEVDVRQLAQVAKPTSEPSGLPGVQRFVRGHMRYVVDFGPLKDRETVDLMITVSYEVFNPAPTPLMYELHSQLELTDDLGRKEARFVSAVLGPAGEEDNWIRLDKRQLEEHISTTETFKELSLSREVPARGLLFAQVQCFIREPLAYHRDWWVTYPTQTMSVVIQHPVGLGVQVRPYPKTRSPVRKVFMAPTIRPGMILQMYEIDEVLNYGDGIDIVWKPITS